MLRDHKELISHVVKLTMGRLDDYSLNYRYEIAAAIRAAVEYTIAEMEDLANEDDYVGRHYNAVTSTNELRGDSKPRQG